MSDEPATDIPTTDPTHDQAAPPGPTVVAGTHPHDDKSPGEPTPPVEHETPHDHGHDVVAAAVAEEPPAMTEALVPVPEPVSEELVPVHEHVATPAVPEPEAVAHPAAEPVAEEPKTDEPPPKAAKKPRAPKAPKTATPVAAVAAVAAAESVPEPSVADANEPGAALEPVADPDLAAPSESVTPTAPSVEPIPENKKKWYAIKVQSGREDSIKAAILRKVRIEGLEEFFGRIEIPFEEVSEKKSVKVKDKKTGETSYQEKKVTRKKKKFQGYLFAELEFNDRILYLFRETSGVGDFLNLRQKPGLPPTPEPMPDHEVQSMLTGVAVRDPSKKGKIKLDFEKGDKVRIREGSFANSEGEVKAIIEAKDPNEAPKVMVVLTFWGRPLDVELDSSQVEKV